MEIYLNELTTDLPFELPKNMKFIEEIDHGAFGQVILVKECIKNKNLAIKVINKNGAGIKTIKKMKEEISILKKLDHSNIVKFYGYIETNSQLLIQMEYIQYGTLSRWMKENCQITEKEASLLLRRVLSAVEYLHNNHICHRDIKPENIMFSKKNDFDSIKIIDFGLSAQHLNYLYNKEFCGTFLYMAPEQIEKKLYYYSVDIWSIGILMFMLLNKGKHPFYQKGDKKEDFIEKIKKGKIFFINKLSFMAKNLIYKLCEPNPSWRYSADLAIKHPWITRNASDEIPLTFNEVLRRNNNKKNAINLLMINVFLNFAKKSSMKNNKYSKKRKHNKIFKINIEYISQCEIIYKKDRERNEKLKERYLEVLSTDEGDSFEKINNYNNDKSYNRILEGKNTHNNYYEDKEKSQYIQEMRVNIIPKNNINLKKNILYKFYQGTKIKARKKSSYCSLLSMGNKNKYLNLIRNDKKMNNNDLNKSNNNISEIKKKINANNKIYNTIGKNFLKKQRNNSSIKFFINKSISENKNFNSEIINRLDKTPENNKYIAKITRYKLKSNLSCVFKQDNNFVKSTNKKISNYTKNYNIIPLILPFIEVK